MPQWMDISVPVTTGMVHWPGDIDVRVDQTMSIEKGDVCNLSVISMSAHTGTHMDAPRHFLANGSPIDQSPLDSLIGPCRLLHLPGISRIEAEHLEPHDPRPGERILLRTRNSDRAWWTAPFDTQLVHLSAGAAQLLASRKIALIGVDYLSVGQYEGDGAETHRALLGAGIAIVEGLNLTEAQPGHYDLICLPVRLAGCDGAPTRAVIRPLA